MSEESTSPALIQLPSSLDKAVTNLTETPSKAIGNTLADIWFLVFGGISQTAAKRRMLYAKDLEAYHDELESSIDNIPAENLTEPSLQVTAQALETSKYCVSSPLLRSMFVNLITGSLDNRVAPNVHPSFPEIIKQMSEEDAKLLLEIKQCDVTGVPIANYNEFFPENDHLITRFTHAYICKYMNLSLDDCSYSLSSLARMGIVEIDYLQCLTNDSFYEPLKQTPLFLSLSSEIQQKAESSELALQKGICSITPLGSRFLSVCVP